MITRKNVVEKLNDYLQHRMELDDMVSWAESAMMDADFDPSDFDNIRDVVARIGLANVRAFGLTWSDCESFLSRLGYQARIEVSPSR